MAVAHSYCYKLLLKRIMIRQVSSFQGVNYTHIDISLGLGQVS